MKRILGSILLCMVSVFCLQAQIESAGQPTPFSLSLQKKMNVPQPYLRSQAIQEEQSKRASSFFITLDIDTTQAFPTQDRIAYTGYSKAVDFSMENSGEWSTNENGQAIWRIGLTSPGAQSMSVVLEDFDLPAGGKVFVYNPQQTQVLGAFMSDNNNEARCLPIRPLMGDSLILEYQEPMDVPYNGQFKIAWVAHNRDTAPFGDAEKCSHHSNFTPQADPLQRAVCLLYIVSDDGSYYASGTLINNPKGKPYIYTAAHNFSNPNDEERTVFYFNYAVTPQDSTIRGTEECSIAGSLLLAKAPIPDFALVELHQMPPKDYRPYMAGWTRNEHPQYPFMCIQHPAGDIKRVSFYWEEIQTKTYPSFSQISYKNGWWWIRRWTTGTTQGGSSGSPLLDKNDQIIGALTGGSSTCKSPISDYFSRFDLAWEYNPSVWAQQLKIWLDPHNEGLTSMGGKDPYASSPCQRITNIQKGEKIIYVTIEEPDQGLLFGHNSLGYTQFAERFEQPKAGWVHGVYYMPSHGHFNGMNDVYACIYEGTTKPEKLLARQVIRPMDKSYRKSGELVYIQKKEWEDKENYVRFDAPVKVGKTFFIGYEIQYDHLTAADSFAVYGAYKTKDYAYYKVGEKWHPFSDFDNQAYSLWVEPIWEARPTVEAREENAPQFKVYPNPTNGPIHWESEEPLSYELYNLQGQLLKQGKGFTCYLPEKGIYILRFKESDGRYSSQKVIHY